MGQPLYCSAASAVCGGREARVMAPPLTHDTVVSTCCPAFFHRHFPLQFPPSHSLNLSLCSQQQPSPWDCSTIPKLQLPATAPSREPEFHVRVCMAGADYLFLILFRLPQINCFTLSLKCFSSDLDNCPEVGIGPLLQGPHPPRASPVLLTLLFSP